MNIRVNSNNFDMNDFKSDLKELEKTEAQIWDFHKKDDVINLFKLVKNRTNANNQLFQIYKKNHEHLDLISKEILEKYPEIKSVNFHNNYDKINDIFMDLKELLTQQFDKLNTTDNLIDTNLRESILNGNKIKEEESEFTTLVKRLLELIVIENDSKNNIESEDKTEQEIIIEDEEETERNSEYDPEDMEEDEEEVMESFDEQDRFREEKEQIEPEESSEEKINQIILDFFTYKDSHELSDEEKEIIEMNTLKSESAKRYANIIFKLEKENKLEEVKRVSKEIFAKTITKLNEYEVEPLPFTYSLSWAIWDIVKQIYYLENPQETTDKYILENPLESEEKQQEIIDRHIGWEVYTQMCSENLNNFLNKIRDPVFGKRVINVMIDKTNDGDKRMPSYKLSELGKNVRMALEG